MVWDYRTRSPKPVTRDKFGEHFSRLELLKGVPQWVAEDPFNILLEPDKPAKPRMY